MGAFQATGEARFGEGSGLNVAQGGGCSGSRIGARFSMDLRPVIFREAHEGKQVGFRLIIRAANLSTFGRS
jgi:hypothetical protein